MSDREAFWGVFSEDEDDNDNFICLCKDEATADTIKDFMETQESKLTVRRVEIVADVSLNLKDY